MTARWYLILFIITILFVIFVAAFNIYENDRIKRKRNGDDNQEMLIILNAIAIFLLTFLLFGYFFAKGSKNKSPLQLNPTQLPSTQKQSSTPQVNYTNLNPFHCQGNIDIISKII
jgi:membrane protease YdiL (CAAX protease family)